MKTKAKKTQKGILIFLLLVLAAPGLNSMFNIVQSAGLQGAIVPEKDTTFSIEAWWTGGYQHQKEKYLNDNIGLRPDLVRLNNQLDYFLFKKLHAQQVVLGKNQELFEDGYIKAYYGQDYIGTARIKELMQRLRFVQDSMQRAGRALLLCFVPSKGRYYPEYFPENLKENFTERSNYLELRKQALAEGVHVLDLNGWYLARKGKTAHPLFSKMGIHWTHWGADYAMDSLNHRLEQLLHMDLPDMKFGEVVCTNESRGENDIERILNLIWPITKETLCYNTLSFDPTNKQKPKVIFVGDSFFWTVLGDGIPQNCYASFNFWNYFNEIWTNDVVEGKATTTNIRNTDWKARIAANDALVLFFTEPNLRIYDYSGMIDSLYTAYRGH